MCSRGWALAEPGLTQDGLDLMRERIDALRAKNILAGVDYFLGVSTQILNKVGDVPKGLASLGEAFDVARSTNQPVWLAEFARLRGELLVQDGAAEAEAEASLREALTIARRQEAKSLELRAATSLARLWQRQGKKEGARELLASVYGWFTEGFDTADLREAKGLLDALV
ncbi:MAG: hypothetical protein DMD54_17100 [Gemmatimonadetes bacterium]|nr:MAG: hypothetical protein DMD54_17100 [Gemmatimonadota bacterium]